MQQTPTRPGPDDLRVRDKHDAAMKSGRVLLLNYHRTVPHQQAADVHSVSDSEFDAQIRCLKSCGARVTGLSSLLCATGHQVSDGVAITFDDGAASDLSNARKLAAAGLTATFFVNSGTLGRQGYLRWEDLAELRALGMTIGSHSHDHVHLTTLDAAEATRQLKTSRELLAQAWGEPVNWLAFPGGKSSPLVCKLALAEGYDALFGVAWGPWRLQGHALQDPIPRNNVIRGLSPRDFEDLVLMRNATRRRIAYKCLALVKSVLSDGSYTRMRALMMRSGPPKGPAQSR